MLSTIQYRLSLAHALHPVSPSLAALHAARAAALHPEASAVLNTTHCPKCGTYRGDHPATKKRSGMKSLQRRCRVCGFSTHACTRRSDPVDPPTKEMDEKSPSADVDAVPPQPKPSHKKTSMLKNMLSRDRQREEANKEKGEGHGALAAFLKDL